MIIAAYQRVIWKVYEQHFFHSQTSLSPISPDSLSLSHRYRGVSRMPFSTVQQAIITAQLTSLISTTSPQMMNYYQRKVARFQPQIVVPNNSPTTSAKHRAYQKSHSPMSAKPSNSESSAGTPRTPWNSPLSVPSLTLSNPLFSPASATLLGHTNTLRIHTAPNPTRFNYYQKNFQSNTLQSYAVNQLHLEKSCDDTCEPFSPLRTEIARDGPEEEIEYETKEGMTAQYVHSTATPYNSPFISGMNSTERCPLDSFVEPQCAERDSEQQPEGCAYIPCPVRLAECKRCLETIKERMIAQYLHSPATPYYSPIQARHQSTILLDANEIFDLISSPRKCE
jgi:hypothetical protein